MKSKNLIVDLSTEFALDVIEVYKDLVNYQKEFVMSKQLLRSGTAIGALIAEAQNAESKKDFIHKLSIAQKECGETKYWLYLLYKSEYMNHSKHSALERKCQGILKILGSIIITSKGNMAA